MRVLLLVELEFWKCWFLWRKENQRTRRLRREPTNSIHIWHRAGIEPGSHCWEATALSTAQSLPLGGYNVNGSKVSILSTEFRLTFGDC